MDRIPFAKNKYLKLLIGFFALMLALTVVSRAADSLTVAKVVTAEAKQASLNHVISAEGTIAASDLVYVDCAEGFQVRKIHVEAGEHVDAGATLFTLDGQAIADQLAQVRDEIAAIDLRLEKLRTAADGELRAAAEDARTALARAREDERINTELNGGKQLLEDQRKLADAEKAVSDAERKLAESTRSQEIDIRTAVLERQTKVREENRLSQLSGQGGVLRAEVAGTVGKIQVEQGAKTVGGTLCTLVPDDTDFVFRAELTTDQGETVAVGDAISLTLPGKNRPISGVTVKSLQNVDGKVKLAADIPAADTEGGNAVRELSDGMTVTMKHEKQTERYHQVIPLSAVRGSAENRFVLVVSESNTILGEETKAVSVPVKVLGQDESSAAVEGELGGKVISQSSKPIVEGDRVREQEQEK